MAKVKTLHQLSVRVAKQESGKKQVSIAQIKEIIKLVGVELAYNGDDLIQKVLKAGEKEIVRNGYQEDLI